MDDKPKLMASEDGMIFEYLAEQEAEFLYEVSGRIQVLACLPIIGS